MLLVAAMMLGACVPFIATGPVDVDHVAEPIRAAPPEATGELTDGERLFQGVWQYCGYPSGKSAGTLRIDGRAFRADVLHGSYAGHVSIRSDTSPAQVDFTIEDCDCGFKGMTSAGVYYEDEGTIVFAAPPPGEPRPESFIGLDEMKHEMVRLRRADPATEGHGEKPR